MAARKKGPVFRVTGLPALQANEELAASLEAAIDDNMAADEQSKLAVTINIVPSCYDDAEKAALVEFHGGVPAFLSELVANPLCDWQVEMGDTDISFDQHFLGFTQLYTQGSDSPTTADIIAITGLDGHAYGSWRGKGNLGRMWLRDFLCKDLPHCRTMIYGYNAKLSTHGVDTILDYGRRLIEELKKVRNTDEQRKRPLFFVAHSFGGIILAHCLVKAAQANEDDHPTVASLHKATYGMLLFGIPHKGLVIDDIQKMLAGESNHPREGLLQEIKSKSDLLAYQLVDFKNLIRDRKVVSFYETGQTRQLEFDSESRRWRRTGDFVTAVDADSALLQLPDSMEDKIPLDADHSMIVKFDNRNNHGYTSARNKLRQFEQDAPKVVAARFSRGNITQFTLSPSLVGAVEQQDNWRKDDKYQQIMKDLRETDPRDDKTRIQDAKGGLLRDSYRWILEHDHFRKWRSDPRSQLLWIKGEPGKGKTMLLCGIIDELEKESDRCLSYFFCQATDARLSNATAVLRGLIYLLVARKPSLISHVREKYDHAGKQAFEDGNAWEALSKILISIINDPSLDGATLVIDALDECKTNRHQLLGFITRPCRVKWVVSGRNWQDIEERLGSTEHKIWLQLELNQNFISKAVENYIDFKVDELAGLKKYAMLTKDAVRHYLSANADGTFLWVALVCKELADPTITRNSHTLSQLKKFPSGLGPLYMQMMKHISESRDAKVCNEILAIVLVVYRPITLDELKVFLEFKKQDDYDDLPQIIKACGSFLTLRDDVMYFVHQSAKDFLLEEASDQLLPSGATHQHYTIFSKSLQALSKTLKRDICKLGAPGFPTDQISPGHLGASALIRYCCISWVDHLRDSDSTAIRTALQDNGDIHRFIRDKYLYWLEFLSLLGSIGEGIKAVHKLEALVGELKMQHLTELLRDARRFVLSHKTPIEIAPLQAYASALLFSPERSLVRELFRHEEPDWIVSKPRMEADWNACLQTLEGHSDSVSSVVFSADGQRLASGSRDETVKIWDPTTGDCLQTLEGHSDWVTSVVFSADGQRLASGSDDKTVKIWDPTTGDCLQTLKGHSDRVTSVVFSADGQRLASGSWDRTVKIWDPTTGDCLQSLSIGRAIWRLSFDPTSSTRLSTEIGILNLELPIPAPRVTSPMGVETTLPAGYIGYSLSSDGVWVMKDAERMLWLPPAYRSQILAVLGSEIAIGCPSGRILVMKFS